MCVAGHTQHTSLTWLYGLLTTVAPVLHKLAAVGERFSLDGLLGLLLEQQLRELQAVRVCGVCREEYSK